MHNRLKLLRAFTALLYIGPLLAGLIGQGWALVAVFAAIFVAWSVIIRPHLWPATLAEARQSPALVAMATLIATQILLVVACFAVGRGIGGVFGVEPSLPALLPVTLSFLAVPLSRLVWNPHGDAPEFSFDPLMHRLENPAEDATALAQEMLATVMALPDDTGEAVLQQHLTAIAVHLDPVVIRKGLGDAVAGRKASRAGTKALIIHATDPAVSALLLGSAYPAQGFAAAGRDPDLLTLFAERCVIAVEDDPDLADDCPVPGILLRAADGLGDRPAAMALKRLAGLLTTRPKPEAPKP